MQSMSGMLPPGALPSPHKHDAFFNDAATQLAISEARRLYSRGTSTHRGSAMRIVKPSSTSNSPRATGRGRRGTTLSPAEQYDRSYMQEPVRNTRPVSWHPNSLYQGGAYPFGQQTLFANQTPLTPDFYAKQQVDAYFMQPHFSPTMAAHSTDTSPCSAFSSLPPSSVQLPMNNGMQYPGANGWAPAPHATSNPMMSSADGRWSPSETSSALHTSVNLDAYQRNSTWGEYVSRGYSITTPPTPESVLAIPQPHRVVATSDDGSHAERHPALLDEEEDKQQEDEEGEILVAMGLYDTPEKQTEDPHLDRYRSTVSSLLGSALRPMESSGKGLMLEQTWEPPASDEEEEGGLEAEEES